MEGLEYPPNGESSTACEMARRVDAAASTAPQLSRQNSRTGGKLDMVMEKGMSRRP